MNTVCKTIVRFLREEDGPTTVEYAMVLLLIFLGLLTAIISIGEATATSFQESGNSIEKAFGGAR
jgi:pilus assembly protein Flp/PilA